MSKPNFVDIAESCVKSYINYVNAEDKKVATTLRYKETLFVAIYEDNHVLCSTQPNILENAHKCILIHSETEKISNTFTWYKVECIDEKGCVTTGNLGNAILGTDWIGHWDNQRLELTYKGVGIIYSCKEPFENHMQELWNVYTRANSMKTNSEIMMMKYLLDKDKKILELKKEIDNINFTKEYLQNQINEYRKILDDLKEIINNYPKKNMDTSA